MATLEDQYQKALKLYQEESDNDPFTDPYKSKYAARNIFEDLKTRLSKQLDEDDDDEEVEENSGEEGVDVVGITRARLAAVTYHLGVIAVETEEFSTGEEHLNKALTILGDSVEGVAGASSTCVDDADLVSAALMGDAEKLLSSSNEAPSVSPIAVSPLTVALVISCHNHLGVLWSNRASFTKAKQHLERACLLYNEFKQRSIVPPRTISSLFSSPVQDDESWGESGLSALEKLHTHTLYYLAQVYGHIGMDEKSAEYCHSTLKRQLSSKDCDLLDWATNTANLSQFYLKREKFRTARHLLSSASKVMSEVEGDLGPQDPECNEATDMQEKFTRCSADVDRLWGRYCLVLLQYSVDLQIPDDESSTTTVESEEAEEDTIDKQLEFLQLDVCDLESQVVAVAAKNFDEARPVFLSGLRWLSSARQYYTMDNHAGDHVHISQEMSLLYKALAFFEPSEERKSKMHKRRIDLLTALIQELNPRYYLGVCRQINYELAETYSGMMDNKLAILGPSCEPTPAQSKKINTLATSSIQHFLHYLDSMKNEETGEQPAKYSEDCVRPALVAWFHLGRLWSKLISNTPESKVQNLAQSLQNYKRVVEYCDKNPECQPLMAQELEICREMVQLLPLKMEQIRNQCR